MLVGPFMGANGAAWTGVAHRTSKPSDCSEAVAL
jgi:hypothetical protein